MRNLRESAHLHHRIGNDIGNRRIIIGQAIDEGGVGTIFQKPAHQIGQQILVAAHRRINPARQIHFGGTNDLLIKRLPHAVEPLKLIAPLLARHDFDGRNTVGIVGGKLRVKQVGAWPA